MLLCDPGFVQKVIQDVSLVLFTAVSLSSRLLVCSFHCSIDSRSWLLAMFEIDFLCPGGVAMYELEVWHTILP